MDGGVEQTKGLAKHLAAWQWRYAVNMVDFCPPAPSMLNIGQLLDEGTDLKDGMAWMLTYTHALQCVGEATWGCRWCPCGIHFSIKVSLLFNTFILETRAELMEGDIMVCWCLGARKIPKQKKDGPFTDIIACLNEFVRCEPSRCEWDELVHLPLLVPSSRPHWGHHLGRVLGLRGE